MKTFILIGLLLASCSLTQGTDLCVAEVNTGVTYPVRSPTYPKGVLVKTPAECCGKCAADAKCLHALYGPVQEKVNCWPLSSYANSLVQAGRTLYHSVQPTCEFYADTAMSGVLVRSPKYPAGLQVKTQGDCCSTCFADNQCYGANFVPGPGANCFPMKNWTQYASIPGRSAVYKMTCASEVGRAFTGPVPTPAYPKGLAVWSSEYCCFMCHFDRKCKGAFFDPSVPAGQVNCWPLSSWTGSVKKGRGVVTYTVTNLI